MSSFKLRKMCSDAIFFSSLFLAITICRDFVFQHIHYGKSVWDTSTDKLSYLSFSLFLITFIIILVSHILVTVKDYNKDFLTSDKSAKRFVIVYNVSLAFFGAIMFTVLFFETFGLGFTPFHLLDLLGAAISVVVIIAVSEVFYSLFFARTNDSLAEEIVSGEIDCEN